MASDQLYLLDVKDGTNNSSWIPIPIKSGSTPGRRYGHTLVYNSPFIILFGGNYNNEVVNDVWTFNSNSDSYQWTKVEMNPNDPLPCPRVYHSAEICNFGGASGMLVVFGGRKKDGTQLNDMWGLRRHRNGLWDWMNAPFKATPKDRIQHSSLFFGPFFINIGGRSSKTGDVLPIEVYDTQNNSWESFGVFKRFRFASFIYDNYIYIHGGLKDDKHNSPSKSMTQIDLFELFKESAHYSSEAKKYMDKIKTDTDIKGKKKNDSNGRGNKSEQSSTSTEAKRDSFDQSSNNQIYNKTSNITMTFNDSAVVVSGNVSVNKDFKELSKISASDKLKPSNAGKKSNKNEPLHERFIAELLQPKNWVNKEPEDEDAVAPFPFEVEDILKLIDQVTKIVEEQPIVLKVETPVKVFGDIHGQYQDLMRFFDLYSAPTTGPGGDIEGLDYIFLGDYVDRGNHSLETICLLIALKIKFPNQIHLLRGNHEDRWINSSFGFQKECIERVGDEENGTVFTKFNDFFDYLPLAAIVDVNYILFNF
ncbi:MAG: metallophosphoesterase [archaeon]|nr:metallophosphoesterase [archaeon]